MIAHQQQSRYVCCCIVLHTHSKITGARVAFKHEGYIGCEQCQMTAQVTVDWHTFNEHNVKDTPQQIAYICSLIFEQAR